MAGSHEVRGSIPLFSTNEYESGGFLTAAFFEDLLKVLKPFET